MRAIYVRLIVLLYENWQQSVILCCL